MPERLALTRKEAAEALGVSLTFFEEHIQQNVRVARIGRRRLVPVTELQAWLDRNAARPG